MSNRTAASLSDQRTTSAARAAGDPEDRSVSAPVAEVDGVDRQARDLFGPHVPALARYAQLLVSDGVLRGLIGPREAPRIWQRHLLNCGALIELIPLHARVVDVGSGAGLPGVVLAIARPDVSLTLLEPLERRAQFLREVVTDLALRHVTVVRTRAEEYPGSAGAQSPAHSRRRQLAQPAPTSATGAQSMADIVTARAVARLDRLAQWCLPLLRVGGQLLALKGASAAVEAHEHSAAVIRAGGARPVVRQCGIDVLDHPATVVVVTKRTDRVASTNRVVSRAHR